MIPYICLSVYHEFDFQISYFWIKKYNLLNNTATTALIRNVVQYLVHEIELKLYNRYFHVMQLQVLYEQYLQILI